VLDARPAQRVSCPRVDRAHGHRSSCSPRISGCGEAPSPAAPVDVTTALARRGRRSPHDPRRLRGCRPAAAMQRAALALPPCGSARVRGAGRQVPPDGREPAPVIAATRRPAGDVEGYRAVRCE
jgi:hypothetical protein